MRLELSLNTKEMELARRIAPELALASDRLLPALKSKMISPEDAKRILIQVATEHSNYLDAITSGRDARKSRRSEAVSAWAIRLYAAQGENAAIGPIEESALHAAGLDDSMIDEVRNSLEFHRTSGFARPGRQKLEGILKQYDIPLVDGHFREAESIYMRGMAAALLNTERRWSGVREDDLALVQAALSAQVVLPTATAALAPSARPVPEQFPLAAQTPATASPVAWQPGGTTAAQPAAAQEVQGDDADDVDLEEEMFDTEGRGLVELVTRAADERLASGDWNGKTCKQHIALANLFVRFIGHDDPRRMRQSHIADFKSIFYRMPKHYGKSPKDFDCSVAEILKRAENLSADERGLSTSTINRHMTQMGNIVGICKHAGYPFGHYEGVSGLRSKKRGDAREERGKFTTQEMHEIFKLPIWTGTESEDERYKPGDAVFHDAAYWVPIVASYSGARREEICGLLLNEVELDFDIDLPCLCVRVSQVRGIKNPQSKRRVPLHPELLRLGFADYVTKLREIGHTYLFPELRAVAETTAMGDVFDDDWQKIRAAALPNAKEEGKVFHSIRHWCNNEMKQAGVAAEYRKDILGHKNGDVNEGRYAEVARLRVMAEALGALPRPTDHLTPQPIRLIEQVFNHKPRFGRPKKPGA